MARSPLRIHSRLNLLTPDGDLGNARWMELLVQLDQCASITAAAKAVGMSYKAAWDAVDAMNNLAASPLVSRSKGGRGGGGTRLTASGRKFIATYQLAEAEHQHFLQQLNARVGKTAKSLNQNLQLIGKLAMQTSARNHFSGTVIAIKSGAVNDEVELKLSGGARIVAVITHESCQRLGLAIGHQASALIKASWVMVGVPSKDALQLSARNQLAGKVQRLTAGAVNSEVVIQLKGGNSVVAIITNQAVRALKLKPGKAATAIFKASSVILGVSS